MHPKFQLNQPRKVKILKQSRKTFASNTLAYRHSKQNNKTNLGFNITV